MYLPHIKRRTLYFIIHYGTFANRKYEELSYTKYQKMCDPILVIVLKMQPHYSLTTDVKMRAHPAAHPH